MSEEVPDARTRLGLNKVERAPTTTAAPTHCLVCGHDRDQHPPNHFAMFGWHCKVVGCSCGMFEPAAPKVEQTDLHQAIQAAMQAIAATQRQTDDARATARSAMRKQLDLQRELQATRDRLATAQAEVERYRAVVEAARECVPVKVGTTKALERLEQALAALDRGVAPLEDPP